MTSALPLPTDVRVSAFRKLVAILQADPTLKRAGIEWVTWDGSPNADKPPPKGRAWVRLTPELAPSEPVAAPGAGTRLVESPVDVTVEVHVPGNWLWDNAANLWGAIEAALYPGPDLRPAAMRDRKAAGLADVLTLQPAADCGPDAISAGKLRLTVFVPG